MVEGVQIGSGYFALTLNLFLTTFIGFLGSVAFFKYSRGIKKREDEHAELERQAKEALTVLVQERHDNMVVKIDDMKKSVLSKIDDVCKSQEKWQKEMVDKFYNHAHVINGDIAEDIIIRTGK